MASAPTVKSHDLDIPRIGYIHSWTRTQDEGWVRAALDTYGVPYQYFGENVAREDGRPALEVRRPHLPARRQRRRRRRTRWSRRRGGADIPVPYKSTKEFPSLGFPDSTDDVRGALGEDGMKALYAFIQKGGTVITEGNTSQILPEMKLTPGVTVGAGERPVRARHDPPRDDRRREEPARVRLRSTVEVPVYFSSAPVLNAGAGAQPIADAGAAAAVVAVVARTQNTTPMATPLKLSAWDPDHTGTPFGLATSIGNDFNVAQAGGAAVVVVVAAAAAVVGGFGGARVRRRSLVSSADPNSSTRVDHAVPGEGRRHAALRHARARRAAVEARGSRRREDRQRSPRDVRLPSVLALADAGHVRDGLQRDHELERSRRRQVRGSRLEG